ncbi:hypothetical protein VPH35_021058 [Triticum aestivum]
MRRFPLRFEPGSSPSPDRAAPSASASTIPPPQVVASSRPRPRTSSPSALPRPRDCCRCPCDRLRGRRSSFLSEQPDGGSLEPDATADGYYYMEAAEDQE